MATKAIVDQKIADAISALKADQAWIKSTGTGGGGIVTPGDNVLVSNGKLVLSLERPVEEELYLADGDHQTFKMTITNNDTTSHTFRLKADFDCETAVGLAAGTILDADYSYSDGAIMRNNIVLPTAADVTNIGFTSVRGSSSSDTTWYIGKQRSESIYLSLTMDYTGTVPAKRWTWDFGLTQKD
jgi:signal peptidase I